MTNTPKLRDILSVLEDFQIDENESEFNLINMNLCNCTAILSHIIDKLEENAEQREISAIYQGKTRKKFDLWQEGSGHGNV